MFQIFYEVENRFKEPIPELIQENAFNIATLASLVSKNVFIQEKRWDTVSLKMVYIKYFVIQGAIYNENLELVYSTKNENKEEMRYKKDIYEVCKIAKYLFEANNLEFKLNFDMECWYGVSYQQAQRIEAWLENTLPIQNFIIRLKNITDILKLISDDSNIFDKLFDQSLNKVVFQADKIYKKYPEVNLKELVLLN